MAASTYGSQIPKARKKAPPPKTTFATPQLPTAPGAPVKGSGVPEAQRPYDPAYQGAVLAANRNVSLGNNEATYQRQATGYDLGYDAKGNFNAANPYSEAQRLQDTYHDQQRATTNNLAATGQLYSGALLNQRGIDDKNFATADALLRRRAQAAYHGIDYGQLQNYSTNAIGVSDADFAKLNRDVYGS